MVTLAKHLLRGCPHVEIAANVVPDVVDRQQKDVQPEWTRRCCAEGALTYVRRSGPPIEVFHARAQQMRRTLAVVGSLSEDSIPADQRETLLAVFRKAGR